jgi:iron complex outermembrane receptor protein
VDSHGLEDKVPNKLHDIIVTATKMQQNVQDVSGSMTVFDSHHIEDRRIEDIADVAIHTPNFMIMGKTMSANNSPVMRGLYSESHSHSVPVGMYVDGVPVLDGQGYQQDMLNIERIEILRGPQGTLYGKSAEGGVINIITQRPDNTRKANISGQIGSDNKYRVSASLSGPILADKLYFGVCALHDQEDGWVEKTDSGETIDDMSHQYGSAELRFTPVESLDISLKGGITQYNDEQPHYNLSPLKAEEYGLPAPEDRRSDPTFVGSDKPKLYSGSLKIDWDIAEDTTITSVTAYRKLDFDNAVDYDFSEPVLSHWLNWSSNAKTSQELRIKSSTYGVKWVTGIYADFDEMISDYQTESSISGMSYDSNDELEGQSGSIFGHVTIPFRKWLRVLGGLRYDYQEYEFDCAAYGTSLEDDWNEISPKLGIEYDVTPDSMAYFTVAKGYLSGGFNAYAFDPDYNSYDEEKLWSYEVGIKNTFFNDKLIVNGAVYYMDIDNIHVQEILDTSRTYTTNAAKATGKGFELEVTALPITGLTVSAGFGYSDLEFDEFEDAEGDYSGNKKPFAPEYSYNFGIQYRSALGWYCRADLAGYGKMYVDKANKFKRDPYRIVNVKLGYEHDWFDIYFYGKNIFDEEYNNLYSDGAYVYYSEPVETGIQVNFRF